MSRGKISAELDDSGTLEDKDVYYASLLERLQVWNVQLEEDQIEHDAHIYIYI